MEETHRKNRNLSENLILNLIALAYICLHTITFDLLLYYTYYAYITLKIKTIQKIDCCTV